MGVLRTSKSKECASSKACEHALWLSLASMIRACSMSAGANCGSRLMQVLRARSAASKSAMMKLALASSSWAPTKPGTSLTRVPSRSVT